MKHVTSEVSKIKDDVQQNIYKIGTHRFDYNTLKEKILNGCEQIVDITTRRIQEEQDTLKAGELKALVSAFKDGAMIARAFIPDDEIGNNTTQTANMVNILDMRRDEIIDVLQKQLQEQHTA